MKKALKILTVTIISAFLFGSTISVYGQDFILKISKIDMKKAPRNDDWRVDGMTILQDSNEDNQDRWSSWEKYSGRKALIPVTLELAKLNSGEMVVLCIALQDYLETGGSSYLDELSVKFKVFPTDDKEKTYTFSSKRWHFVVHYTLHK
jgi:hypothetical protein